MGLVDSVEMPQPIKFVFNWGRKYSLWVFNFGLACCAIEFIAASMGRHDFIRLGVIPFAPGPRRGGSVLRAGRADHRRRQVGQAHVSTRFRQA